MYDKLLMNISANILVNCVLIHFEKMHVNCSSSKEIGDMFVYQIFLNSEKSHLAC